MDDYMMDPDVAEEAERVGIPYPFYEVRLSGVAMNGRYGEIRIQFEDREDAGTYQGWPLQGGDSPVREALEDALGAPLISSSGGIMAVYNPREWQGERL